MSDTRIRFCPGRGCRPRDVDRAYFKAGPGGTLRNDEVEVFLNGNRRPSAVEAHVTHGWVRSRVIGEDGCVEIDGVGRPKFVTEHGTVELRRCND